MLSNFHLACGYYDDGGCDYDELYDSYDDDGGCDYDELYDSYDDEGVVWSGDDDDLCGLYGAYDVLVFYHDGVVFSHDGEVWNDDVVLVSYHGDRMVSYPVV